MRRRECLLLTTFPKRRHLPLSHATRTSTRAITSRPGLALDMDLWEAPGSMPHGSGYRSGGLNQAQEQNSGT